ncbi:MAG: hypothetical protein IRY85_20250 [Micromonosporaceae bacterium]|nr:hypothetical protein [Micromonosporaceae bacterium]
MGQRPVAVVVCGAAGTLVGFGVYALLRRRLPFSSAWPMARARLAQARRARARMERELMEQAHRKRVDRERAHRERAYRTQGRRR